MIKYPCRVGPTFTRVWEAGAGDRTVVLIHDAGLRLDWWTKNFNALAAQGVRIWCFDLPGHGFADKDPEADHSVAGYVAFVRGLIAARGIERPVLVGAGLGGQVAASLACEAPASVAGLALCAPTGVLAMGPNVARTMRSILDDTTAAGAAARARLMVSNPALIEDGLIEDDYCINASPGAAESFAVLSRHLADHLDEDLLGPRLRETARNVPTRVIWGRQDAVAPVALTELVGAALAAPVVVFDHCGHAAYFEQPAAFNAEVLALVDAAHR